MTRRHRPRRSPTRIAPPGDTVLEYFFKGGDFSQPRKDPVRRDELWGALEWFHRGMTRHNRWHRRLLRSIQRLPVTRLNPFEWARLNRKERGDEQG